MQPMTKNCSRSVIATRKLNGVDDEKQKEFLRGFMANGISTGLIDKGSFNQLIAEAHEKVFGMSIPRKHYEKMINGEETSFFDTPTVNRPNQKISPSRSR